MLPDREDGHFVRDTLRFFELEAPTFRYTLREAIDDGHLVPYRIYKAMTDKTAAEDGFEVARGELDGTAMDQAARAELEKLFACSDPITTDPRALERFTIPERNRAIVREFREAHEKGFRGEGVPEAPGQRQHARYRLRLSGGGQPSHGAVHGERHPLRRCADAARVRLPTSARPTSRSSTSWA